MSLAEVVRLEDTLARRLPPSRLLGAPPDALLRAAADWSAAVWSAAVRAGPIQPSPAERAAAGRLAPRAVFVGGAHRSGTTLLRNLLDAHPELIVLPSEGTFHRSIEPRLRAAPPADRSRIVGTEWVRRTANPINQPPYFLLGRSTPASSPYVDFARRFLGWWDVVAESPAMGPHLAVVLAWATSAAGPGLTATAWVDKTPLIEREWARLKRLLPEARLLHVVRDPAAVLRSRRRLDVDSHGDFRHEPVVLRDIAMSLRIAGAAGGDDPRHAVVRYEDLCADPARTMERVAGFIGIPPADALLRPTVAGLPAVANSSFTRPAVAEIAASIAPPDDALDPASLRRLAAHVRGAALRLGYELPEVGRLEAMIARGAARMRRRGA